MGRHFFSPVVIQAMGAVHSVLLRIEADGHFAAWVVEGRGSGRIVTGSAVRASEISGE